MKNWKLFFFAFYTVISPIDNPYDYVKELQSRFDNSGIEYSDEYYDVLGIDRK